MALVYATAGEPWVIYCAFVLGGLTAGLIARSATAIAVPVVAAGMTAFVASVIMGDEGPFDVSPFVMFAIGIAMVGILGIPTALVGAAIGRKLWGKPGNPHATQ